MLRSTVLLLAITYALAQCPSDKLCMQCSGTTCKTCYQSYPNASGVCTAPTNTDKFCISYSADNVCATCNYGYYPKDGVCTLITIKDCLIVSPTDATVCTACDNSIAIADGVCTGSTPCSDTNCKICTAASTCVACDPLYSLTTTGTCVSSPVSSCDTLASDNKSCALCSPAYYQTSATSCVVNEDTAGDGSGSSIVTAAIVMLAMMLVLFK